MKNHWQKILFLPACIACAAFSYEESTVIPVRQERDECVELKAGASLVFSFTSSISARFDIHRHIGDDVVVLDKVIGSMKRGPKTITIPETGLYCLNWKNRYREDMDLNFSIEIQSPPSGQ